MRRVVYQCPYCADWTWTMIPVEKRSEFFAILADRDWDNDNDNDVLYGAGCDDCWGK